VENSPGFIFGFVTSDFGFSVRCSSRSMSGPPKSARDSVLLFVKRGTWNVERAGRRPALL